MIDIPTPLSPPAPVEFVPPIAGELRRTATTLLPAQFKAAVMEPVLVPVHGPGSIIVPLFWVVSFIGHGTPYSAARDVLCLYAGEPQQLLGACIGVIPVTGTSFIHFRSPNTTSWSPPAQEPRNKPVIALGFPAAPITGGDSRDRLFITMWYTVANGHTV